MISLNSEWHHCRRVDECIHSIVGQQQLSWHCYVYFPDDITICATRAIAKRFILQIAMV